MIFPWEQHRPSVVGEDRNSNRDRDLIDGVLGGTDPRGSVRIATTAPGSDGVQAGRKAAPTLSVRIATSSARWVTPAGAGSINPPGSMRVAATS
jgi:hypothetical protein